MTALVTGGAGYVGSHVVRTLRNLGLRVVVIDRLDPGRAESLPDDVPLMVADIRDRAAVRRCLREHAVDTVLHLAAEKSVAGSMADPGPTFSTNTAGTLTVLQAMLEESVYRLVFSSTCAVYGPSDDVPINEDVQVQPMNPYGESKAQAEAIIRWFSRAHGLRAVTFRYFNAAGADPAGDLGESWDVAENLIPRALRSAALGIPLEIYGTDYPTPDGTAIRDYVHVTDLAAAHASAVQLLAAGEASRTLNLGTGTGASVRDVVDTVRRVTGRTLHVVAGRRRDGDAAAVWADPGRAAAVMGWRAERTLDEMVGDAWRWHMRSHAGEGRGFAAAPSA